ncbi:ribonuclease H family protein [Furfurilactobacillus entadae]|uniref:ribonuclease H family protein n=1 Tax=Furfurilactobacillus entadae TaxID=2922307 RepID=UPI0035E6F3BE
MAGKKFYAVAKGKKPGIYTTWPAAKQQVDGVAGARYKSFPTETAAKQWLAAGGQYQQQAKTAAATPVVETSASQQNERIVLYSDGGSRNTGNVAGGHVRSGDKAAWAYLVNVDDTQFFDSLGEFGVTNNKMEITGLLMALRGLRLAQLADQPILAVLDSKYVLDAITKHWLAGWQRRGWQKSSGGAVANQELWQAVSEELPHFSHLRFEWTKGHADNRGNVFVDELLNQTMDAMSVANPTGARDEVQPLGGQHADQSVKPTLANDEQLNLF